MSQSNNTAALVSLICGILCLVGSIIPVVQSFTTIFAILAIVFGVKGRGAAAVSGIGAGQATIGLVLGIIGVFFAVCGLICTVICAGTVGSITDYIANMQ